MKELHFETSPLEGEVSNAHALLGGGPLARGSPNLPPTLSLPLKGGGDATHRLPLWGEEHAGHGWFAPP